MTWTIPTTRATGDLITASIWNNEIVENSKYIKNGVPVGAVKGWLTDTAPTDWLLMYGQAISRATYSELFALIGTQYGVGDASTTFNLPDVRGRTIIGTDDMGGSSANNVVAAAADTLGGTGGSENHTLITAEMPAHSHTILQVNVQSGSGTTAAQSGAGAGSTGSAGSGSAHNNMQPYIALNWIVKAQ